MTNSNIIRCLVHLLKGNPILNYTVKEQKITQDMWKHIKEIDETTFNNIAKRMSLLDINEALCLVFTDGTINHIFRTPFYNLLCNPT